MKDYLNQLSKEVIGAAIEVHRNLGTGWLESAYEANLQHEIALRGFSSQRQFLLPITYKDLEIPDAYRTDLLVENSLVVELKTVPALLPVHSAQVLACLKMSGKHPGLLINYHTVRHAEEIKRLVHNFPE